MMVVQVSVSLETGEVVSKMVKRNLSAKEAVKLARSLTANATPTPKMAVAYQAVY